MVVCSGVKCAGCVNSFAEPQGLVCVSDREMQKELKLEENDFRGAVFEGKFYAPDDFKALETMPTRLEIYAKLLGTLKGPSSQMVGVLQVSETIGWGRGQ